MKEKIKKNWKIILASFFVIMFTSLYFLFVLDVGINSKYFIRRDFNNAFLYRKTGNCTAFKSYFLRDVEGWSKRCIEEKDGNRFPIKDFFIKSITVNGNTAFLQVELFKNIPVLQLTGNKGDYRYTVTYGMEKINKDKFLLIFPKTKWMITDELRDN